MKKSVLVRIIAAAMAIALCVCSVGALTGCTQTRKINVLVYGQYIDLDVISNFKKEHGIKVSVDECELSISSRGVKPPAAIFAFARFQMSSAVFSLSGSYISKYL